MPRIIDLGRITNEQLILRDHLKKKVNLETKVQRVNTGFEGRTPVPLNQIGIYRTDKSFNAITADLQLQDEFRAQGLEVPVFLEAGPRERLRFDPHNIRAAIVTAGGVAPGLHCVIHSIVKRHLHTYGMLRDESEIYGVYNSFKGLCNLADNLVKLDLSLTDAWLDQGGSKLGCVRHYYKGQKDEQGIREMAEHISGELENNRIDILYVIGGDGSARVAHEIAARNPKRAVVSIPKTMDNDILWVWRAFGFDTAVEQATRVINTLKTEAEATRRIALIELFGAESGFVAANAALASGHVDAVLIPEVFKALNGAQAEAYLNDIIRHVKAIVEERDTPEQRHTPHAVVVVAEGVETAMLNKKVSLAGKMVEKGSFMKQLAGLIHERVVDAHGQKVATFDNEPRHFIRSSPANAHDQVYCERLGALAVDTALAGFTDCLVSQWMGEFVMVPLPLVALGQKGISLSGMFWKQVVGNTGHPLSPAEN